MVADVPVKINEDGFNISAGVTVGVANAGAKVTLTTAVAISWSNFNYLCIWKN